MSHVLILPHPSGTTAYMTRLIASLPKATCQQLNILETLGNILVNWVKNNPPITLVTQLGSFSGLHLYGTTHTSAIQLTIKTENIIFSWQGLRFHYS